ncbi:MAG: hypothetical protein OSB70_01550 [Myxococcota bacterium]|nr:hypothetical protein [Myxococcota bacterium]
MIARILLALGTVALVFFLMESSARIYEGHPPWEGEWKRKKPESLRIGVVGGSTIWGTPVPELGFVAQLEALLPSLAGFRSVDVVNRGKVAASSRWVRRVGADALIEGELDALLIFSAHNEFLNRSGEDSRWGGLLWEGMLHSALVRLTLGQSESSASLLPERLDAVDRESTWFDGRLEGYRENLSALIALARDRDVPVLLMTAPVNLADWPPVHHRLGWEHLDSEYETHVREVKALVGAGDLDGAERAIDAWRVLFGEDAMFSYLEGKIAQRRGDVERAARLFRVAADLDPYPWRALSEQNDFIRALAQEKGVTLVDLEGVFAGQARGGLVGFDLIGDNVHPTPLGGALMANEAARGLGRAGLPFRAPGKDVVAQLARFRAEQGDRRQKEYIRLMLNGRYSMKTPFFFYEISRRYLESAHALAPEQWMGLANLGSLALLEGKEQEGLSRLRRAARLRGEPIDPQERPAVPMLVPALEAAGLPVEAIHASE